MQVVHTLEELQPGEPVGLTIGVFDGLHAGHCHLLRDLSQLCPPPDYRRTMLTFTPHPRAILRPDDPFFYLTTLEEKLLLVEQTGLIDTVIVLRFTHEVADMSPAEFLGLLQQHLNLKAVVVGPNFHFGQQREGNVEFLRDYGQKHGFAVQVPSELLYEGQRVSSTRIRSLLTSGDVETASRLLGHFSSFCGTVVEGDKRGRLLGFPTANLLPDTHQIIPANGVYAVRASYQSSTYPAVANIGVRPTFQANGGRTIEVHLFDFNEALYGQQLRIDFIARLREERKFAGIAEIRAQIAADAKQARELLLERKDEDERYLKI